MPSWTATPIAKGAPLGEPQPAPEPDAGGFFGYAFPVDSRADNGLTRTHTGSGTRIYLGNACINSQKFFNVSPFGMEMARTIYHELTHKVVGANDNFLGVTACRRCARSQPLKARRNADSFGYMATSLGFVRTDDGT